MFQDSLLIQSSVSPAVAWLIIFFYQDQEHALKCDCCHRASQRSKVKAQHHVLGHMIVLQVRA